MIPKRIGTEAKQNHTESSIIDTSTSQKCWVVSTHVWVKYGQTQQLCLNCN